MKKFIYTDYVGRQTDFYVGQRVQCYYYHERINEKFAYKRTWFSKIIDKPFEPVKFGVIIGYAGIHPFYLAPNNVEQFLLVKFSEYKLAKPIPISCITDALLAENSLRRLLENNQNKVGSKGFGYDTFSKLQQQLGALETFNSVK